MSDRVIALKRVFYEVFGPAITAVVLRHEKTSGASQRVMGTQPGRFESVTIYVSQRHRKAVEGGGYRAIVIRPREHWLPSYPDERLWEIDAGDNVFTRKSTMVKDLHDAMTAALPEARRLFTLLTSIHTLTEAP